MKSFKHVVNDPMGIHARPAGVMVKMVSALPCEVTIEANGKKASAKKIIGIMSLGVKQGQTVEVFVDGEGEDEAVETLKQFFAENF